MCCIFKETYCLQKFNLIYGFVLQCEENINKKLPLHMETTEEIDKTLIFYGENQRNLCQTFASTSVTDQSNSFKEINNQMNQNGDSGIFETGIRIRHRNPQNPPSNWIPAQGNAPRRLILQCKLQGQPLQFNKKSSDWSFRSEGESEITVAEVRSL